MTPMLFSSGATPVASEGGNLNPGAVAGTPEGGSDGSAAAVSADAFAAFDAALLDVLDFTGTTTDGREEGGEPTHAAQAGVDGAVVWGLWQVVPQAGPAADAATSDDGDAVDPVDDEEASRESDSPMLDLVTAPAWSVVTPQAPPAAWSLPVGPDGSVVEDAATLAMTESDETRAPSGAAREPSPGVAPTAGRAALPATATDDEVTVAEGAGERTNAADTEGPSEVAGRSQATGRSDTPVVAPHGAGVVAAGSGAEGAVDNADPGASVVRDVTARSASRPDSGHSNKTLNEARHARVADMPPPPVAATMVSGAGLKGTSAAAAALSHVADTTAATPLPDVTPNDADTDARTETMAGVSSDRTVPAFETADTTFQDGRRGRNRDDSTASDASWLRRSASLEARLAPPRAFTMLGSAVSAPTSTFMLPAVATAVLQAPFDMPAQAENLSRLVHSIRIQARDSVSQANVRLNPEHLGEVTMTVRVDGGTVTAVVRAESGDVRQWLRGQEDSIRTALAEQGLTLDELVVDQDGRREHEHQQQEEAPRRARARVGRVAAATFEVTA